MTRTIKLYNSGKRTIQYGKGKNALFKPNTTIEFPIDDGQKLLRLYEGEVRTSEQHVEQYVPDDFGNSKLQVKIKVDAEEAKKAIEAAQRQLEKEKAAFLAEKEAFEAQKVAAGKDKEPAESEEKKNKSTRGRKAKEVAEEETPSLLSGAPAEDEVI